jgi:hypothetical protein
MEIEPLLLEDERISRRARAQDPCRQDLAQPRDVDLHHLLRRLRHVLAPEVVDDPVGRERAVRVHEQQRQERTRLASSQQHLPIAVADLERSEDAEVHASLPREPQQDTAADHCCAR